MFRVLMEGIKYYANDPRLIGKVFLRLERDFDKHVTYCTDEPKAQDILAQDDIRDFYEVSIIFYIKFNSYISLIIIFNKKLEDLLPKFLKRLSF